MDRGYIKLWRKTFDNDMPPNDFKLFFFLVCRAEWQDGKKVWFGGKEIELKRGQLTCGRKELAKKVGMTEGQTREATKRLKSTSRITIETTTKFSLVTILNYDIYQQTEDLTTIKNNHKPQPTNNQRTTTLKELKNTKNSNNVDFVPELKRIYEPMGISVDTELGRMKGWLLTRPGRKLTKKFAVGWLNRNLERNGEVKHEEKPNKAFPVNEYF